MKRKLNLFLTCCYLPTKLHGVLIQKTSVIRWNWLLMWHFSLIHLMLDGRVTRSDVPYWALDMWPIVSSIWRVTQCLQHYICPSVFSTLHVTQCLQHLTCDVVSPAHDVWPISPVFFPKCIPVQKFRHSSGISSQKSM
jgi:hypothetical protein